MELRSGENIWSPPKGGIGANLERANPDWVQTQENSAKEVNVTCKFGEASQVPEIGGEWLKRCSALRPKPWALRFPGTARAGH